MATFPRPTATTNQNDPGFELDLLVNAHSDAIEAGGIGGNGSVLAVVKMTQAQYDALGTKDPLTLYVVT